MKIESAPTDIRVLLFDVGGVLVQLSGVETMLEWLGRRVTADELWRMWLESVPVRKFETGRIDASEFAAGVTSEFGLPVEPRQFLEAFIRWLNVEAAQRFGMHAIRVRGATETHGVLTNLGIIDDRD